MLHDSANVLLLAGHRKKSQRRRAYFAVAGTESVSSLKETDSVPRTILESGDLGTVALSAPRSRKDRPSLTFLYMPEISRLLRADFRFDAMTASHHTHTYLVCKLAMDVPLAINLNNSVTSTGVYVHGGINEGRYVSDISIIVPPSSSKILIPFQMLVTKFARESVFEIDRRYFFNAP